MTRERSTEDHEEDLIQTNSAQNDSAEGKNGESVEPLPESTRPRKDGPGGD